MELISRWKSFGGEQKVVSHPSRETGTDMEFSIYLPPVSGPRPVLYYLSGLTCTWENVTVKGGFQKLASELGLIIVCPDTSPRGLDLPEEHDAYDFGSGAGFYLNATTPGYKDHYRMEDYVTKELHELILEQYPADSKKVGIFGHSMGGHGALTLALKNPELYRSVSAFAPICAPLHCPWGEKALTGYLGEKSKLWRQYDACALIEDGHRLDRVLVDQGSADSFLNDQLKPELLQKACSDTDIPLEFRLQDEYDHSYYFIASFMGDHLKWHARQLEEI